MIEDIAAQAHGLLDTLTFKEQTAALSALRTLSDHNMLNSPFSSLLGIEIVSAADGRAETRLEARTHLLNSLGILHGGVLYSLADTTTAVAAATQMPTEKTIVTQDLHCRYHAPVRAGLVTAVGQVLHVGRRTIVVECRLYHGERLAATADGTFALINIPTDNRTQKKETSS